MLLQIFQYFSCPFWPRFFLDGDGVSVVTSSGIQAMTIAGTRVDFTRTSYLLKVQIEVYKVQART